MLRSIFVALLALAPLIPSNAATRYVTDRAGAPVKWQEWGDGAIARARTEKRPIFVSVGFAASYECERMHREVFINGEVAELLNTYFVPVLLDRIQYPEIASAYEDLTVSMTGSKPWPANLILTPSLEPFAAGGAMSTDELSRMLVIASNRWADERAQVTADAHANVVKALAAAERPGVVDEKTMEAVVADIAKTYDPENGGFGAVPRTPHPTTLTFLLRHAARTKNENLRGLAVSTLRRLAVSQLRDQLGGGFHRATRGAAWREPFFEKMLPDQALLGSAYLEAWQLTKDPDLLHVARTTFDYVLRDLQRPRATFDASQDAHNLVPLEGPEFMNGAFYLWNKSEIAHLLGPEGTAKVMKVYPMGDGPRNLPVLADPRFMHETYDELAAPLQLMLDVRQKRPAPFRQSGVAGWNGLMISSLSRASAVLNEPRYLESARTAAAAVTSLLWVPSSRTLYRDEWRTRAIGEDYAMLVGGMLDLFEADRDVRWLDYAFVFQQRQDELFWDAAGGRYISGTSLPEVLRGVVREHDDGTPSLNAVSAVNLMRLAALTGNTTWMERPQAIFKSFGGALEQRGEELASLAEAYELSRVAPQVVVVTGDPRTQETYDLFVQAKSAWAPMREVVFVPNKGRERERVTKALPFTAGLAPDPEHPVAYLCANGECLRQ